MTDSAGKDVAATVTVEPLTFSKAPVVLVVEEEAGIRELLFYALQKNGFTVYLARNGQEAVTLFASLQWEVDVVLLDWGMDGMNGPQTLEALHEMNPRLPWCYMTGGASVPSGCCNVPILAKPFTIDMVIKEILMLVQ